MPCRICGAEAALGEDGVCQECAGKAAAAGELLSEGLQKATEAAKVPTDALPAEMLAPEETPQGALPTSRTVAEIGQSEAIELRNPFSVAVDDQDNVVVLDQPKRGTYRITLFAPDGQFVRTLLECGQGDGQAQLKFPKGVALDRHGNLYIPDAGNNRIQRFDADGTPMGPVGSEGEGPGELSFPCDVEIDDAGLLYVADTYNCRIQKLTPQGVMLLCIGFGDEAEAEADTSYGFADLDEPLAVAIDREDNILVADTNNHRVVKFSPEGTQLLAFGAEGTGPGRFMYPSDIRVQADGTIFVADRDNSRVQKFDPQGSPLTEFALQLEETGGGAGGDIAVDSGGCVWICDYLKHVVARVELLEVPAQSAGDEG
ncbi:MAG: NHL repeat-containing protein [Planctomycetota bacterium]|jgi:DNA-binding beta-propeller fold protein YncE